MRCPHCGATTEVIDKRGPFRARHCTNPACGDEFTTCENLVTHAEHRRCSLRTLDSSRTRDQARPAHTESSGTAPAPEVKAQAAGA